MRLWGSNSSSGGRGAPPNTVKVGPRRCQWSRDSRWNLSGISHGQVHPEQPLRALANAAVRCSLVMWRVCGGWVLGGDMW